MRFSHHKQVFCFILTTFSFELILCLTKTLLKKKKNGDFGWQRLALTQKINFRLNSRLNINLIIIFIFFLFIRERERELFGPKKRGPKPETFLLKVGEVLDFSGFHSSCLLSQAAAYRSRIFFKLRLYGLNNFETAELWFRLPYKLVKWHLQLRRNDFILIRFG